ncbi:MAG: hypothetical protein BWY05_01032 [Euryarchaeota archaeon ADurb.Bin165]|nr:MAG: hypothetical protein BWY05_01032 [Euryarchaeota archaeon ADurb.Bin165]
MVNVSLLSGGYGATHGSDPAPGKKFVKAEKGVFVKYVISDLKLVQSLYLGPELIDLLIVLVSLPISQELT